MSAPAPQYILSGGKLLKRSNHAPDTTMTNSNNASEGQSQKTSSTANSITEHDFRFPRRPDQQEVGGTSRLATPQIGATNNERTTQAVSADSELNELDFAGENTARKDLLRESFFPTWKDDSVNAELDSPDEMQKKDPLATQIWRLYSKTKKQLPNQERMENLTWRMMAMSLRRRKQEEAARYVLRGPYGHCFYII